MKLIIPVLMNVVLVILIYLLDKKTRFEKLNFKTKQCIIGVLFGLMAIFASETGVAIGGGAAMNVRDSAPISAGLIFGWPSGVIAGTIGGVYRYFAAFWGSGTYTQLACSISTVVAGIVAATLRRFMFDNKKPSWAYGVGITVFCEIFHMLMIFITNMNDAITAFDFVRKCTVPMVTANVISVTLSLIAVTLISKEKIRRNKKGERISQTFQRWLLICILIAYFVTSAFTFHLQSGIADAQTLSVITLTLDDVKTDITEASDANILDVTNQVKDRLSAQESSNELLDEIASEFSIAEINIVGADGIITHSTNREFLGFDMNSGTQSAEFMVLLESENEHVQSYQPTTYDASVYRKYAAVKYGDGFIQVGYDSKRFRSDIDEFIVDATKNRHIGTNGFVAICDSGMNLITDNEYNNKPLEVLGFDKELTSAAAGTIQEVEIKGNEYYFSYDISEGYYIIGAMAADESTFMRDISTYLSVFMQILIFASLFILIYFLIKKIIINNLYKINSTLEQITEGNLNVTVDVRTNEEFASLSDDINSTVDTLKKYIAEAAARIDKELEYAKTIQLSALPQNFPTNPRLEKYDLCARMIAAKEVGGDFYDFYKLDDHTVAFLVADVSGKGIPAAMFMMTAKTILKELAERKMPVNEIFTVANEKLCENNDSGMFVTAWMGIIDLETGVLKYANAGHNPPLVMHGNGGFEYLKSRAGFVLAGMEGVRYRINEITMQPGDRIFLYTDGVTEATDINQELYGEERLHYFLNSHKRDELIVTLYELKDDIDMFVGEAPQFDDITMLIFDYNPYERKAEINMSERVFDANEGVLPEVIGFVEEELVKAQCPIKTIMGVSVAIEEVFVNVAHYSYGEGTGKVRLRCGFDEENNIATFEMADNGVPFDPLKKPDPDITLSAEDREIGGLGIFITKKTMDTVTYRYENGENILTMVKKYK